MGDAPDGSHIDGHTLLRGAVPKARTAGQTAYSAIAGGAQLSEKSIADALLPPQPGNFICKDRAAGSMISACRGVMRRFCRHLPPLSACGGGETARGWRSRVARRHERARAGSRYAAI